jgi:hypothetical protein
MKTSGLDIHKDSIFCAIYDGKSYSVVKEFTTTTVSIRSPGEYLRSEKVKMVAMESTSYWVTIWGHSGGFAAQKHVARQPGARPVNTGAAHLHARVSQLSESAHESINANGQGFGHVRHPAEQLHQQH